MEDASLHPLKVIVYLTVVPFFTERIYKSEGKRTQGIRTSIKRN